MNVVEFWYRLTILFRLVSVSFAIPAAYHSSIMSAVRNGDYQALEQVVAIHPQCLRKFRVEYWSKALKSWSSFPDSEDRRRVVMILMNQLRNKNEKRMGMTPLICAVKFGDRQAVNYVARFSNVDGRNKLGQTALIVAIRYGLLEIAEELLDHGADANIYDEKKRSAIHYACRLSDMDTREKAIWLLLANHADVSFMNAPYAIKYDRVDIDKVLNNDPVIMMRLNGDELIVRRIKMEVEEFGMTFVSAILLMAFAAISHRITQV